MKLKIFLLTLAGSTVVFAEPQPATPPPAEKVIFAAEFSVPGVIALSLSKMYADQRFVWTAGVSLIQREFGVTSGGDSAGAQYYKDRFIERGSALFVRGAFDWNGDNMNDPGWYFTTELGVQKTRVEYNWGRYDDDPAVFRIGGDGLRLQESGDGSADCFALYIEPGFHFQFSRAQPKNWYFDLGLSAQIFANKPNSSFINTAKGTSRNLQDAYPVGRLSVSVLIPL